MSWREAVDLYLGNCEFSDDIEAVFVTGSYATGNADARSDIDLYIVLSDKTDWRERGCRFIGDYLVEYFANPVRQAVSDINGGDFCLINMLKTGIVVLDKAGIYARLLELCDKQAAPPPLAEHDIPLQMYFLWDTLDELGRAFKTRSDGFAMIYSIFLEKAMLFYFNVRGAVLPPTTHLFRWLTDSEFRRKYGLPEFSDNTFLQIAVDCYRAKNIKQQHDCARRLYAHIENSVGGFEIGAFSSRIPLKVTERG